MIVPSWISDDGQITLLHGDCREVMAGMEPESVSCVVTSPPFWGLRKYDCPPSIWGGDPECSHSLEPGEPLPSRGYVGEKSTLQRSTVSMDAHKAVPGGYAGRQETPEAWVKESGKGADDHWNQGGKVIPQKERKAAHGTGQGVETATCSLCGAWRGWLGLEPTVEMFVAHTIEWMREVKRVLRSDGVFWLDLDDSRGAHGSRLPDQKRKNVTTTPGRMAPDVPGKSLCLIPQRVAIAALEDGWIVRSEIIIPTWMPESARDRPTDASRKVLMLTKTNKTTFWWNEKTLMHQGSPPPKPGVEGEDYYMEWSEPRQKMLRRSYWHGEDYWYDAAAVRVPAVHIHAAHGYQWPDERNDGDRLDQTWGGPDGLRNLGSVWDDLPPSSYPAAHFATFPVEEPERCIIASCPPEVCPKCGKARVRMTATPQAVPDTGARAEHPEGPRRVSVHRDELRAQGGDHDNPWTVSETTGWTSCACRAGLEPGLVLDPFIGTGTTCVAAVKLGRRCIGIDLSEEYLQQAVTRLTVGDKGVRQMVAARRDGAEQGVLL